VKRAKDLLSGPKGTRVEVAGLVICRQRPATASGVVFMTLEDETGFVNLVLWARKFEELHRVATTSSLVRVKGKVDRSDLPGAQAGGDVPNATIHVIVDSMTPLARGTRRDAPPHGEDEIDDALPSMSRDFH
jgi:DNA polymerase III alpha subunit